MREGVAIKNNKFGFTLIEVLIAVSLTSIILLSFSTIIINTFKIHNNETQRITKVQKAVILKNWLNERLEKSSEIFISKEEKLNFIEKNNLYKLVLYSSAGIPALGVEKYKIKNDTLKYSNKEPIINGVYDFEINEINDYGFNKYYEILLSLGDFKDNFYLLLNRGGVKDIQQ
ncbi:MAG: prepilin-type N-terminal cleavage/methylation domain-containing protein [Halanaerobiales bacterium]|nr:prepilin-type N-terminal cleavage/methylation domain-containing protein [Halanaerobiales bacterium]